MSTNASRTRSKLDQVDIIYKVNSCLNLMISSTATGGTKTTKVSGNGAVAVDKRILATSSLKNVAKSPAVSFDDGSCFGGGSRLLTVSYKRRGLFLCSLHDVVLQNELICSDGNLAESRTSDATQTHLSAAYDVGGTDAPAFVLFLLHRTTLPVIPRRCVWAT